MIYTLNRLQIFIHLIELNIYAGIYTNTFGDMTLIDSLFSFCEINFFMNIIVKICDDFLCTETRCVCMLHAHELDAIFF